MRHHGLKLPTRQKLPIGTPKADWLIEVVDVATPVTMVSIVTTSKGVLALKLKQAVLSAGSENTVDRGNGVGCQATEQSSLLVYRQV